MIKKKNEYELETNAVHAGERNTRRQNRSVTIPIEQTATYYFENTQQIIDFYNGELSGVKYGRYGCPTQHAAEEKLARLEKADRALLFSSGMAAITTTILSLVSKGQHILFTDDCYRNTKRFFIHVLPKLGIEATEVPIESIRDIGKYAKDNTALFFSEVPTSPFLRVIDLESVVEFTSNKEIVSVIDSTFASPVNLCPVDYGTDLVIHSATKYLGGHNDLFAGVVAGDVELIEKIQEARDIFGAMIDPHTSYLLLRSLHSLPMRMESHNKRGLFVARYLEMQNKVERVWYPGCKSHPDYKVAKKQMKGFGGVVTFSLKANEADTSRFIDNLKIPYIATNFGGSQSLIEQHALLAFYKNRVEAEKIGIGGNLLRFSVGFESVEDIVQDFENAFSKL